jgi:hypothetical protein
METREEPFIIVGTLQSIRIYELMLARLLFKVMSLGKAAIEDVAGPIGARGEEMKSQFLTRLFRETRS